MAKNIGDLSVKLTAETSEFKNKLKDAEKGVEGFAGKVAGLSRAAGVAGAAIGVTVGAVVGTSAAVLAMARDVATSAKELENLARIANTDVETFQKLAYGAQQFGVEQDKLSDILKDVTEKTGEYLATGGGGMKDFFEQIAPAVGVTAEEFRNLSGPQALGLYVQSLEKAGISQDKMTFYMESLASDATLLLPLMRNNGQAMREFGQEADNAGRVLSKIEVEQLAKLKKPLDDLSSAGSQLKNEVVIELLPEIQKLTEWLTDPDTIKGAKQFARAVIEFGRDAVTVSNDLAKSIPFFSLFKWVMSDSGEEAEEFANRFQTQTSRIIKTSEDFDRAIAKLKGEEVYVSPVSSKEMAKSLLDLKEAQQEVERLQSKAKFGYDFQTMKTNEQALEEALAKREKAYRRAKELEQKLLDQPKTKSSNTTPAEDISIAPTSKEDTDALKELERLRERQARLFDDARKSARELQYELSGLTEVERELAELQYNQDYEKMDAASKLALQATIEERAAIQDLITAKEKQLELQERIKKELADTPIGLLAAEAEYRKEISNWLEQGLIDLEEYWALSEKADEAFSPKDKADEWAVLSTVASDAARMMANDFVDFAKSADQSFSDFAKNFLANIAEMIAQAVLFNAIQQAGKAMSGSETGWISAIGGAISGSANGNVFAGSNIVPFATGGIVSSPTYFPLANGNTGLMGEAGAEAILPLKRINGKLGVQAAGMSQNNTQINNVNVTVQGGSSNEQTGAAVADAVMRAIARQEISNARRVGGLNNPVRQGI